MPCDSDDSDGSDGLDARPSRAQLPSQADRGPDRRRARDGLTLQMSRAVFRLRAVFRAIPDPFSESLSSHSESFWSRFPNDFLRPLRPPRAPSPLPAPR